MRACHSEVARVYLFVCASLLVLFFIRFTPLSDTFAVDFEVGSGPIRCGFSAVRATRSHLGHDFSDDPCFSYPVGAFRSVFDSRLLLLSRFSKVASPMETWKIILTDRPEGTANAKATPEKQRW